MRNRKFWGSLAAIGALMALVISGGAADQTIVVSGDTAAGENQPGWLFNRDASTSTPFEFNADAASIGQGSLYVLPIGTTAADKFIGEFFLLEPIANVDSVSYDFLIGSGGAAVDGNQFYLNVYANFGESNDLKFYDCRYDVVPSVGSTSSFTTITFDPAQAYAVTTRGGASASPYPCPSIPADMDLDSPNSTIRAFAINVGDTNSSDAGLDGYYDNVIMSVDGMATTFDFEPLIGPPTDKDECKQGGWVDFNNPEFKNQGDCVSFVVSNGRNR